MTTILIAYLPALFGIAAVAFLVFLHRRQARAAYVSFSLCLLQIVLWLLFQMLSLLVSSKLAVVLLDISLVFSNLMVPFFLLFTLFYTHSRHVSSRFVLSIIFLPAVIISVLGFSDMIIYSVHNDGIRQLVVTGPLYIVQSIYIVLYTVAALTVLGLKLRKLSGTQKSALQLLLLSFAVPVTVNVITNYVLRLDESLVQYFLPTTLLVTTGIIAYAMVRHRLFDIRLVFVRTTAYVLALITLSAIYYLLAYLVSVTLFQGEVSSSFSISPINIFLALLLAFIFQPIKRFFDKITNDIFFRDQYDSEEFFARLSEVLTTTTDLRGLLQRASHEIGSTLKASQAFFFVYYNHVHHVTAGTKRHSTLPYKDAKQLNLYVSMSGRNIIVTDLIRDDRKTHRLLVSHKIAVLVPLFRRGEILGYLALGEQQGGGYAKRDIKMLDAMSDELVIAIQNALSVQEVRDINTHLEQRIDAATKELRSSNAQLRHLDATKDEFLSMASHQLRTPLTSVKGYLSMVLEGDAGHVNDMQKHLLGEAFTSSERMVHLIHDFLNVSRLQTGKFILEQRPIDLGKLVDSEVRSLKRVAETRKMKLKFISEGDIPMLNIDENKIQQVVMNFIDNAIYYSHENTTITVKLERSGDDIELRVIDTGIGVPKSESAHLFSKFYRASNARKQRPDGTGVGLYLAKKVITSHGGDVLFESLEGEGSTFGFRLPVASLLVRES